MKKIVYGDYVIVMARGVEDAVCIQWYDEGWYCF